MFANWTKTIAFVIAIFSATVTASDEEFAVSQVLDDFHKAASEAEGERYFSLLADDAVFIGTDATERWNKKQFLSFAQPYFSAGKGWTYVPKDRHISFTDVSSDIAWFDELLDNENYGECRGTGVLVKTSAGWKVSQYHLTIPIPNNVTEAVVSIVADYKQGEN